MKSIGSSANARRVPLAMLLSHPQLAYRGLMYVISNRLVQGCERSRIQLRTDFS